MKPFLLTPACKDYVWGGSRLREYGKISDADRIAESWELSCHPDGESIVASGEFAGQTLRSVLQAHPEALGENCRKFADFPVLVKLIDAHGDLSVQVHPDDAYAKAHGGGLGKTELWYILEAEPGAEILYGVKEPLTPDELRRSIEEHTILEKLMHIPVKPRDVFFIPAGTLHAIGKGILLAEIQESSNTTYRVYDYDRGRELHIAQALEVARLTPAEMLPRSAPSRINGWRAQHLGDCAYFYVTLWEPEDASPEPWRFGGDSESFVHLLVLDGQGALNMADGECPPLQKGASLFLPAGSEPGVITGEVRFISTEIYQ